MFGPHVKALRLVTRRRAAHPADSSQHPRTLMNTTKTPASSQVPRDDTAGDIWFETKWGMTIFVVAACLAGSGLLLYLAIYLAWL
jgi:hypothetical protein